MAKLHELLAVEGDLEGTYKKILEEARNTFAKKPNLFYGSLKRLEMFDLEAKVEEREEHMKLATTVGQKLEYVSDHVVRYLDAVLQKEMTNQIAKNDLIIEGTVIATGLPATYLLGLETKLKNIRAVYEAIPTLPPSLEWVRDEQAGEGVYRLKHTDEKMKTAKTFMHKVLYEATDKHPAQIEKWEEQKPVGKYLTDTTCGLVSPAEKSEMLGRIDKLIRAVKQARQRANTEEVLTASIGNMLVNFIHGK